jgi:hypothetical protein
MRTFATIGIRSIAASVTLAFLCISPTPALGSEHGASASAGLQAVDSKALDKVLVAPGGDFQAWNRAYLAPSEVEFRRNWLRDQNRRPGLRIREDDVDGLKADLAGLVHEVFREELEKAGFTVVDEPGDGVLTLHPNIVELDIVAPDLPTSSVGRTFQYSQSAGEMTLDLLVEGDGATLARIQDRKREFQQGWFEWRTRVSNRADAKRWLRQWGEAVGTGLAGGGWDGSR